MADTRNRCSHSNGGGLSYLTLSPFHCSPMSCALHAALPKASWLADRELQNLDWPGGGLPHSIHLDNAREFHSDVLVRGCQEYGIQLDHRPVGVPTYTCVGAAGWHLHEPSPRCRVGA